MAGNATCASSVSPGGNWEAHVARKRFCGERSYSGSVITGIGDFNGVPTALSRPVALSTL